MSTIEDVTTTLPQNVVGLTPGYTAPKAKRKIM
jgi:hypothetical protein